MIRKGLKLLTIGLLLAVCKPALAGALDGSLEQMLRGRDLRGTQYSICVIDADTHEVLAEINPDESMIPASNMKLLTTAAALDILGENYVFRTELGVIDPQQSGGKPSLLIKGDGDPALGDPILLKEAGLTAEDLLNQWVNAVKQTGQTSFDKLIVDDRVFDRQLVHPSWPHEQLHKRSFAQVAGINFHDNCLHVLPSPASRAGLGPKFELYPDSPFLTVFNSATTGKANEFWVDRKPGTNELTLRGKVKSTFYRPVSVTLNDPPVYLAQLMASRLGNEGIRVEQIVRPGDNDVLPEARAIHRVDTLMPAVLRRTNQDSQNLFAESLLKRMGYELTGAPGNWENGAAAVRHALARRLDTHASAAAIADGSGLSRDNRVTSRLLAELLQSIHNDERIKNVFLSSLSYNGKPDSGEDDLGNGTLDGRFKSLPAGHWVYGKSGYIRGVYALSGYLIITDPNAPAGPDGAAEPKHTIAFSFLFNGPANRSMKGLIDQMVMQIDKEVGG